MTPASTRSILSRLLRGHRSRVGLIAGLSMLGGLAEAVFLVVITRAAFAITDGDDSVGILDGRRLSVNLTVVLALGLVLVRVAMSVVANWHSAALNADVVRSLRHKLAHGFLRSTWAAQQSARAGHLQELVTTYSGAGAALLGSFSTGLVAAFSVGSLLALAAAVDPIGSLVAVGALGVLGFTLRPLRRKVQVHARKAANDGMSLALATNEISGLGMVVHVFDVRDQVEVRVDGLLDDGMRSSRRLGLVRGLVPAIYTGLAYLALVGAIGLASVWETASLTSLGAVMLVMLRSLSYGQQLQTAYSGVASSVPAVRDVFDEIERFSANEFIDHGSPVEAVCPLRLEHVSFHYTESQPVLTDVSAEIRANELIGVVGPSGSGKSTLVQLLLGLRVPTSGRVLAAGCEIQSLYHGDWARKVTFVPQSPALIHGTIAENVRFYRDGFTDADVENALQMAGLLDEVTAFPDGAQHQVGDHGRNLSGGQQQRLCIARALVARPELMILDEPTSALDARSEQLIRDTVNRLRSRMTVIIIAHRLSTLDECDRIMIIQGGKIAAFESPKVLRESSNFYAEAIRLSGIA